MKASAFLSYFCEDFILLLRFFLNLIGNFHDVAFQSQRVSHGRRQPSQSVTILPQFRLRLQSEKNIISLTTLGIPPDKPLLRLYSSPEYGRTVVRILKLGPIWQPIIFERQIMRDPKVLLYDPLLVTSPCIDKLQKYWPFHRHRLFD